MPGRQLLMSFPVTATSHALADYRARGGYATLEKALASMTPQQITAEVTASGRVVRDLETREDVQGQSIKLTIDASLQDFTARRIGEYKNGKKNLEGEVW